MISLTSPIIPVCTKKVELDESSKGKGRGRTRAARPQSEPGKSAYLSVGGQFVKKTVVEPDMLENDQTLSFFALVFGRDVVPSLEEKSAESWLRINSKKESVFVLTGAPRVEV